MTIKSSKPQRNKFGPKEFLNLYLDKTQFVIIYHKINFSVGICNTFRDYMALLPNKILVFGYIKASVGLSQRGHPHLNISSVLSAVAGVTLKAMLVALTGLLHTVRHCV